MVEFWGMKKKVVFMTVIIALIVLVVLGYQRYGTFSEKDRAWLVLQSYLKAAKGHNTEKVKSLSYQIGEACDNYNKNTSSTDDCNARMDTVYYLGKDLKKDDFKNVWSDSKQIILTTELKREENENLVGLSKAIIYFIINENGKIKLLKFNDSIGMSISKENRSMEEINNYLNKVMADDDQDGMLDDVEQCFGQEKSCIKTDPQNRDSDGDGFWDGVQAQFYEKT